MDHAFGRAPAFALGVEEELLLVDAERHRLVHAVSSLLPRLEVASGEAKPDLYEACIELVSPVSSGPVDAVASVAGLRAAVAAAGGVLMGAGIHPDGAFGDVVHVDEPRYRAIGDSLRGLGLRTPTCALHVHVSLPDPTVAIAAFNELREHLPVLQALAANSPFWHGVDSGMASARANMFRAYPRAEVPGALRDLDDFAAVADAATAAADVPDYTFLWWDLRPHPRLGTVELRAMDAQSSLATVTGLAALVQALAAHGAATGGPRAPSRREALSESSYRASRDGLDATIRHDGALRPVREVVEATLALARPHAGDLGTTDALAEIERVLVDGNGAERQRAAFRAGGMEAMLAGLVRETAAPPP